MKTVAIIGVGLIGGSLGQALRRSKRYRVIGISRDAENAREARRCGAVDHASTDLADVKSADVVVICRPVEAIVPTFQQIVRFLKPGAIVTDVGSVKGSIMQAAARVKRPSSIQFVGGHPLAGSHQTGVKASSSRLFEGSTVVLVPGARAALKPLKSLWNAAGAHVRVLSAPAHDRAVAFISHLPHALAFALTNLFSRRSDRAECAALIAGSFRDATRVAGSDPTQWAQIMRANAKPLARSLAEFRGELSRVESLLNGAALPTYLRKSHAIRRSLFKNVQ